MEIRMEIKENLNPHSALGLYRCALGSLLVVTPIKFCSVDADAASRAEPDADVRAEPAADVRAEPDADAVSRPGIVHPVSCYFCSYLGLLYGK